jgi:hypothetical protein
MKRSARWVIVGIGIAAMAVASHLGACVSNADKDINGTCGSMVDDGNPCTIEFCEGNITTRENAPPSTPCKIGDAPGTCNSGQCQITCDEGQCPQLTVCQTSECSNGKCVISNLPMGPIPGATDPMPEDCQVPGCDGAGKEENVADDMDKPADQDCITYACKGGAVIPTLVEVGNACAFDSSKVCDETQACVTCIPGTPLGCTGSAFCHEEQPDGDRICSTCYNGVADADESDVDCGGPSSCQRCELGKDCNVNTDCGAVGDPPLSRCASSDGVCCTSSCLGDCELCALPGFEGTCLSVPAGEFDPPGTMCLCNSSGNCVINKSPNGEPCESNVDCASGECVCPLGSCVPNNGTCKRPNGSVCTMSEQCAGSCVNNLCEECDQMIDNCPGGTICMNGDCVDF